ncbi:MAG: FUSC family protein, partial [Pusillimonas sp.]
MASHLPQLQRFFYSHYFIGGLRQAIGVLLPAVVLISLFQMYGTGMVASVGAACVAVIDQPGNPRRNSINMMLVAVLLGSATAAVTGLATAHILLIWLAVPALCFLFSMLTVYGKQGGLMAFACLLVMTLTLRTPMAPQAVLLHTISTFLGGLFYFVYSYTMHRLMWHREEQQTLSVALFATAEYVAARARFYDVNTDLETCYRDLVHTQADMIEK